MDARRAFRSFSRGFGHRLYSASRPVLKALCLTGAGRAALEVFMRAGGRTLLWAFDAREQSDAAAAQREWERVLAGIGLEPRALPDGASGACATCFARCTLDLKPGDGRTCDTVMSINDEMLTRLGGRMVLVERLTDSGASRCVVRVVDKPPLLAGERPTWCDDATAEGHFDRAAAFYDFIMGYFEIPANRRALRCFERGGLELADGARIVELGVGTGLSLAALVAHSPESAKVIGVDRSRGMIERARKRIARRGLADRVEFVRADAAVTGLATGAFDGAFSSFLLDQFDVEKRRAVLAEVRRLLKPGARACFVVMDGAAEGVLDRALASAYAMLYGRWNPVWKLLFDGYAPHCRPVRLRELFGDAGLRETHRERSRVAGLPVAIYHVAPI